MVHVRQMLFVVALIGLVAAPSAASGQTAPSASRCAAPEHRQFDFWVGEWDVTLPDGKPAGTNRIEPILGGCALRESWTGVRGMSGHSYNIWDATRKVWHQTWVDSEGNLLQLEGGLEGGRMRLEGVTVDSAGARVRQRIIWEPTGPGRVRQLWEASEDDGATWNVVFDGRYAKR